MNEYKSDHDLLTEYGVKIDGIIEKISDLKEIVESNIKEGSDKCLLNHKDLDVRYVNDVTFKWIIGIVFVIIMSISTSTVINSVSIEKNKNYIEFINKQIEACYRQQISPLPGP